MTRIEVPVSETSTEAVWSGFLAGTIRVGSTEVPIELLMPGQSGLNTVQLRTGATVTIDLAELLTWVSTQFGLPDLGDTVLKPVKELRFVINKFVLTADAALKPQDFEIVVAISTRDGSGRFPLFGSVELSELSFGVKRGVVYQPSGERNNYNGTTTVIRKMEDGRDMIDVNGKSYHVKYGHAGQYSVHERMFETYGSLDALAEALTLKP